MLKICPLCKLPIENVSYPHFHIVDGEAISAKDLWKEEQKREDECD